MSVFLSVWPKGHCELRFGRPSRQYDRAMGCKTRVASGADVLDFLGAPAGELFAVPFTSPMGPCVGWAISSAEALAVLANGWHVERWPGGAFAGEKAIGIPPKYTRHRLAPDVKVENDSGDTP